MKRSITGMILGMLGGTVLIVTGIFMSFFPERLAEWFGGAGAELGLELIEAPITVTYGVYALFGGGIVAFFGALLCAKMSSLGGTLLFVGTGFAGVYPVWFLINCIQTQAFAARPIIYLNVLFLAPLLLCFLAMLLGFFAKRKNA